jgi:hypothetical protein
VINDWSAERQVNLVPGIATYYGGVAWRVTAWLWVPLFVLVMLTATRIDQAGTPVYALVAVGACVVNGVLFGGGNASFSWSLLGSLEDAQDRKERAAGYTTRIGVATADEVAVDVDVVDPKSGRVIRFAHEKMPRAFFMDRTPI